MEFVYILHKYRIPFFAVFLKQLSQKLYFPFTKAHFFIPSHYEIYTQAEAQPDTYVFCLIGS
jgi:hypothetical protein